MRLRSAGTRAGWFGFEEHEFDGMFVTVKGGGQRSSLPPQERGPAGGNADEEDKDGRGELSPLGRSLLGQPWPGGANLQRLCRLLRLVMAGPLHINSVCAGGRALHAAK